MCTDNSSGLELNCRAQPRITTNTSHLPRVIHQQGQACVGVIANYPKPAGRSPAPTARVKSRTLPAFCATHVREDAVRTPRTPLQKIWVVPYWSLVSQASVSEKHPQRELLFSAVFVRASTLTPVCCQVYRQWLSSS